MKKIFTISLLILSAFVLNTVSVSAESSDNSSAQQHYVKKFIIEVFCQDEGICSIDENDVSISKEKVYDIFLNDIGYVYDFSVNTFDRQGFIIIDRSKVDDDWEYVIKELNFEVSSPYVNKNQKNIYLGFGQYFEKDKDVIFDLMTKQEHDYQTILNYISENFEITYPTGGGVTTQIFDPYSFLDMTKSETFTPYKYPLMDTDMKYTGQYNNCSPTAGVSLVLYWDRTYTNLLYGVNPTAIIGGEHIYKDYEYYEDIYYPPYSTELSTIRSLHNTFYNDMQTNSYIFMVVGYNVINTGVGTVPSKFYNELEDYFDNKGLTLHHVDIIESADNAWGYIGESMTGSKWTSYKNQIDLGRPVVIQLGVDWSVDYTLIRYESYFNESSSSVNYHYWEYESMSAHTVVGYGYRTHTFYQMHPYYGYDYVSRIDNFMVVANGWGGTSYVNASDDDIGMAYSVYPTN
jgi:hypothetical protein